MKKLAILFCLLNLNVTAQNINFDAYSKITDPDFSDFVNLFPNENLPINSDELRRSSKLDLSKQNITSENVEKYLKKNGSYLVSNLYVYVSEDEIKTKKYGFFQPVCKLPTNGDYVMLVIYQVDARSEITNKVLVLSYDLNGKFIEEVGNGYLISGMDNEVSTGINEELIMTHIYLPDIGKSYKERWACKPCTTHSVTDLFTIEKTGHTSLLSSTDNGESKYIFNGLFFKPAD